MPMDVCAGTPGEGHTDGALADAARIQDLWNACRSAHGAGGDYLFGRFSIADAMFAPVVSRFRTYGVALDPVSAAYVETVWSLPAITDWVAEAETEDPLEPPF